MKGIRDDILDMALQIADETAVSDIQVYAVPTRHDLLPIDQGRWYDVQAIPEDEAYFVDRAVQYALARELIRTHPQDSNLVQIIKSPAKENTAT